MTKWYCWFGRTIFSFIGLFKLLSICCRKYFYRTTYFKRVRT